jgi:hypothetical protein
MRSIIDWLLEGDPSIQYQTRKYLLDEPEEELKELRSRIAVEGWGAEFLSKRNPSGHWSREFYQVKWVNSHYTLLDLRYLEIEPVQPVLETLDLIVSKCMAVDGSINESHTLKTGDICINGMFLNYASFFGMSEESLKSVVDFIISNQMPDGGFNCMSTRSGAIHSSMHTTISVIEGVWEYMKAGYTYRLGELEKLKKESEEFLLCHRLYKSDKTGEVIDKRWTKLSYPSRWRYDILRALIYFSDTKHPYDPRMDDALDVLLSKRKKTGEWPVQQKYSGDVHFDMELTGKPSRWNTLRALRVLKEYGVSK